MNIEEFLRTTSDLWDSNSFQEADNDQKVLSRDAWIRKWAPIIMSNKDMVADFYRLKNTKPLPERLRNSFGDLKFNPTDAWKQQIYQTEYKDVPREEYERVLSNMKKYYDEDQAAQDSIKRRNDRVKEVKNWDWYKDLLTSDYAKQRYIEEPETSLFGEQAPAIGKAPETRWAAGADLAAGTLGTAADLYPPTWYLGPLIRAGRDITYTVSDSKYSKDPREYITNRAGDLIFNASAKYLANARKGQRIANQMTNPEVGRTLAVDATTDAINESLGKVNSLTMQSLNDKELINLIKELPESPMKADLIEAIKTAEENLGRPVNRKAITDVVAKYKVETSQPMQDLARGIREGNVTVIGDKGPFGKNASTYLKDVAQSTPYEELTKGQKASYLYNKLVGKINTGKLGQSTVQGLADYRGRDLGTVKYDNSEEFERQKEYYKQTRAKDWLRFGPAFAPKEEEGSPIWEAYKEVMGIK